MRKILSLLLVFICFAFNIEDGKNSILIGDSNVGVIKFTNGFKNTGVVVGPYKGGINISGLIGILNRTAVNKGVKRIFVAIGTNDRYTGDFSYKLKSTLHKTYPNATEFWVIWGSRGWGGVKWKTIADQEKFYNNFEKNGFKQIKVTNGYFPNDKLSHSWNQTFFIEIVKKINSIQNER